MTKIRFSLLEKKSVFALLAFFLVQIVIIFAFFVVAKVEVIDIENTKKIDVVVEDIYTGSTRRNAQFVVVADSENYYFGTHSTKEEYSVNELCRAISVGDSLLLTYYESDSLLFGSRNIVVDARNETEVYRSFEAYNLGRGVVSIPAVLLFALVELLFAAIVFLHSWLNYTTIKKTIKTIKGRFCD